MAEILVLGAGMAGVGAALALQARGHDVTLVDRRTPGQETSFGNAGVIQAEARAPYALPRAPLTLLKYALGRSNDVALDLPSLPGMVPALWQYFRNSTPARHARITESYAQLIARAVADHERLILASGAGNLIRQNGMGEIYERSREFDKKAAEAEVFASEFGLAHRVQSGAELRGQEPAMIATPAGAVQWDDCWSCADPGALVQAYAQLFARQGGAWVEGAVQTLAPTGQGWRVATDKTVLAAEHVVVALGPWSPTVLKPLGYDIPMVMKRGYHSHYEMAVGPSRPYVLADLGVVLSTMAQGVRITSGAHLAQMHRPLRFGQLEQGRAGAGRLFALGAEVPDSRWHGTRPCLPGMLPMVGRAPKHKGLWFHFGHGHQGFTLGPTTGEILAEVIGGHHDMLSQALAPAV